MTTSIRLEPAFEKRLDHRAAVTGRMKALYLPELVARGLDDLQDYFLADATMARVRSGQEQVFSWDQVERRLGLAWRIELTATETKQLAKLDKGEAKRTTMFLRQRLAQLRLPRSPPAQCRWAPVRLAIG